MSSKPYHCPEVLRRLYHQWLFSHTEIADFFDVSRGAIEYQFDKHGIETRDSWESSAMNRVGKEAYKRLCDKSWLQQKYCKEGMSAVEISNEIDCSYQTVYDHLDNHGIETRKSTREMTPDDVRNNPEQLKQMNHEAGMTLREISEVYDMSSGQISVWFAKHGIDVADNLPRGESHHAYNGGRAKYGPGWNETKKEKVRERDGRECQNCGLSERRHVDIYGCKHSVHHIQKASEFDDPENRNSMSNLATLCKGKCHSEWEAISPLKPQIQGV